MPVKESVVHELETEGRSDVIEHEYDDETPASIAVIHAICALTDVDPIDAPVELGFVLHRNIDSDALDTLLGDGTGDGETVVSFEVTGRETYAVDISDDGRIEVQTADSSR